MNQRFASLLAVVLGVLTVRITVSGDYLNYVRRGMMVWLLLSGAVLIVLGIFGWLAARSNPDDHAESCSAGGHSHALSRAAWLLVAPIIIVGLTQPTPLGSFAAERQSAKAPRQSTDVAGLAQKATDQGVPATPPAEEPSIAPSPTPAEPIPADAPATVAGKEVPRPLPGELAEMNLLDFLEITYYDESESLAGVPVRLVGFTVPAAGDRKGEFLLSRFMINCCAADATLMQAGVKEVKGQLPAKDAWVSVTGRWYPHSESQMSPDGFPVPELVADKVEVIPAPEDPYLSLAVF